MKHAIIFSVVKELTIIAYIYTRPGLQTKLTPLLYLSPRQVGSVLNVSLAIRILLDGDAKAKISNHFFINQIYFYDGLELCSDSLL